MATVDYIVNEFHAIPAAFSVLASVMRQSNPAVFRESAAMLDMAPCQILRGLAYISYCLSTIQTDDHDPIQLARANMTIGEMTELMARLIEHQNEADNDQQCANQSLAAA